MTGTTSVTNKIKVEDVFQLESNQNQLTRLYRFLSYPQSGFILCQVKLKEQNKMFHFFENTPMKDYIYMLDMASPPLNLRALQEKIHEINEGNGPQQKIIFIHNIKACITGLGMTVEEYLARLNFIRDFFGNFKIVFVFFMPEDLLRLFFLHAFDFYDWFKIKVVFLPEILRFSPVEDNVTNNFGFD